MKNRSLRAPNCIEGVSSKGIKPIQAKWTMDDCKYFQKLVVRKSFVSILVSVEKDELYKCDTVLNLNLIDTSSEKDVYISQLLIDAKIAVESGTD